MAESIREQVMVALAALVATALPEGWKSARNPERAPEDTDLPYAAVLDGGQREVARATQMRAYEITPLIELAAMGATAATVLNAGYAAIKTKIEADIAAGTGPAALAVRIEEAGIGEPVRIDGEGEAFKLVIQLDLLIEFWTKENDPTALGP